MCVEMLKFKSPRSSICFLFTFFWAIELEGSVDCSVRVVLCQKSPTVRLIDRIINRGELKRHSNEYKEDREKEGGRERVLIKCWIVEFIVHKTAPSPTALVHSANPPHTFFFSFFFLIRENAVCQFPW